MLPKRAIIAVLVLLFILPAVSPISKSKIAYSQAEPATETEVKCGDIIENEFINDAEDHIYLLSMQPRESFDVALEPAGDDLKTIIAIYGATGVRIKITGDFVGLWRENTVSEAPKVASDTLSARGPYKIRVANTGINVYGHQDLLNDKLETDAKSFGGVGVYTLSIGCTKADGSRIEPGDVPQPTPTLAPALAAQTGEETSLAQESTPEAQLPFLEVAQTYEIAFGSQTKIVKVVELRNDGWVYVDYDNKKGWLNINQVALITLLGD